MHLQEYGSHKVTACSMWRWLGDPCKKYTPDLSKGANVHMHNVFLIEEIALDRHQEQIMPGRIFSHSHIFSTLQRQEWSLKKDL